MKHFVLACLAIVVLGQPALAADGPTSAVQPTKPAISVTPPPPDPGALRQGGDTLADAVLLTLPAVDVVGTTEGYTDDYYEDCPYGFSTSPDVVYYFVPETDMVLDVDLCGSSYDTHVFVYDEDLNVVGCNDDFYSGPPCGAYVSKIEEMFVVGGVGYYVVINGYGGQYGPYLLNITENVPCVLECPVDAQLEGEPEIVDGYVDDFNGGCNSTPVVYSPITNPVFCGKSGYYLNGDGQSSRDLDWFEVVIPAGGVLEIVGDGEEPLNLYQIEGSCDDLIIENGGVAGECAEFTLTVTGTPGETVRVLAGATRFWEGATYEFDYILVSNIESPVVTESHSWTSVKALFE